MKAAIPVGTFHFAIFAWVVASILFVWLYLPSIETKAYKITPGPFTSVAMIAAPSFMVALIIQILRMNSDPLAVLFAPTRARLVSGIALWMVTPVSVFLWLPISGPVLMFIGYEGRAPALERMGMMSIAVGSAIGCYTIACILSSGLRDWRIRLPMFVLFWLSVYVLLFLYDGFINQI